MKIPDCRQAGVIQTTYEIAKALGGELNVETREGEGSEYQYQHKMQIFRPELYPISGVERHAKKD